MRKTVWGLLCLACFAPSIVYADCTTVATVSIADSNLMVRPGGYVDVGVTIRGDGTIGCAPIDAYVGVTNLPAGWMAFFLDPKDIAQPATSPEAHVDQGSVQVFILRILAPSNAQGVTVPYVLYLSPNAQPGNMTLMQVSKVTVIPLAVN